VLRRIRTACIALLAFGVAGNAFVVVNAPKCHRPEQSRQSHTIASRKSRGRYSLQTCHLFFRPTNVEKSSSSWKVPRNKFNELSSLNLSLPWRVELEKSNGSTKGATPILSVRTIRSQDIQTIVEMCVQEYGSGPASFPLDSPLLLGDWIDREGLRLLVDWTTRLKVAHPPNDHAIIVSSINDQIIGMVEVSLQPVIPERNPPPYPIPLYLKRAFARVTNNSLQGWITNLLIVPEYRGQGHSKILVAACEGVAASWRCTSIHLHCDADQTAGQIAQKLYTGMGYQTLRNEKFSWMDATSSVFSVQGVPLLYLRKDLWHEPTRNR
jgi:ribosomal protein S18 acetylase RimI-like enzyme